jgi:hypothetical protein
MWLNEGHNCHLLWYRDLWKCRASWYFPECIPHQGHFVCGGQQQFGVRRSLRCLATNFLFRCYNVAMSFFFSLPNYQLVAFLTDWCESNDVTVLVCNRNERAPFLNWLISSVTIFEEYECPDNDFYVWWIHLSKDKFETSVCQWCWCWSLFSFPNSTHSNFTNNWLPESSSSNNQDDQFVR